MARRQTRQAPVLNAVNDEFNVLKHHYIINSHENISFDVDMENLTLSGTINWNGQEFPFTAELTRGGE